MCDVKKFEKIYEEIKELQPEDTLQIELESEDENVKDFYAAVGDYIMQKKQKELIKDHLF